MSTNISWVEVALIVDGETAEAVAEILRRFAPNGVVLESTDIQDIPDGVGRPIGPLKVCAYLPVDEDLEKNRQKLEEALWYLGRLRPVPIPEFKPVQETNWTRTWRQHYRPINIGQRLQIVPAWLKPLPSDRLPVYIEPGLAFGTGTHPTTQLCLEMIEEWVQVGQPVIDVGCGSGILSIAALKLGASEALGVDTDPQAVQVAEENARNNGVAQRLQLGPGSVQSIASQQYSLHQAPLVIANILAPVLIQLLQDGLSTLLSTSGKLVLSGILAEQQEALLVALRAHRLVVHQRSQMDDWIALAVTHAPR